VGAKQRSLSPTEVPFHGTKNERSEIGRAARFSEVGRCGRGRRVPGGRRWAGQCVTGKVRDLGRERRQTVRDRSGGQAGQDFLLAAVRPKEKKAILAALDLDQSGFYNALPELEIKWQKFNRVPFAKTHMNGTSALLSMYFALDLPPGSEIMVPSYTFFGTITTMRFFGCVPVFVDINPRTATFDLEHAKKVLNPRVRAMVPMHSWGLPCEMDHICDFAKEHDLDVLEDCAHAHGASMQGKESR